MTRRHFEQIATAIHRARNAKRDVGGLEGERCWQAAIDAVEGQLTAMCTRENPNFNAARFHEACAAWKS